MIKENYYILAGGPGSGKTSVLRALAKQGFLTVSEAQRSVIAHQLKIGGKGTPDQDKLEFCRLTCEQFLSDYQAHIENDETIFFDRGLPDILYAEQMICGRISDDTRNEVAHYRYNHAIFMFPPWEEIFVEDGIRPSFKASLSTYSDLRSAYTGSGYELIEVPMCSVEARVNFILSYVLS